MAKKFLCFLIVVLLVSSSLFSIALCESDTWICPSCGTTSSGNFCSNCGTKKPETVANTDGIASDSILSENILLTIHIDFDENAMFSTYDVEMYLDDTFVEKMAHGKNYDGTLEVSPGEHTVSFFKAGSTKVKGTCDFEITEPSTFSCNIHANSDKVTVSKVKVTVSEGPTIIDVNGQTELELTIDFRKNAAFSTYDVDLYCDDVLIATLPHGEGFHGILKVSEGIHTITFYEYGNHSKTGKSEFSVHENTVFSCHIEATSSGIVVSDEKLNNGGSSSLVNQSDYINACVTVQYKDVERNPEQYKGKKIKVSGKVIQVMESGSSVTLRVSDARDSDNIWYVTYKRSENEARILEDDNITLYGECRGVVTYTTILGSSVTIPGVNAVIIEQK